MPILKLADFDPQTGHLHSCPANYPGGRCTGDTLTDCAAFLYTIAQDAETVLARIPRRQCPQHDDGEPGTQHHYTDGHHQTLTACTPDRDYTPAELAATLNALRRTFTAGPHDMFGRP